MPTPTGKPRVGERVRWEPPEPEHHGKPRDGMVVTRYDGIVWGLKILWDGDLIPSIMPEAGYYMEKGWMRNIK